MNNNNLFNKFSDEDKRFIFDLRLFDYCTDEWDGSRLPPDPLHFTLPSEKKITIADIGEEDEGSWFECNEFTDEENEAINAYFTRYPDVGRFDLFTIIRYKTGDESIGIAPAPATEGSFTYWGKTLRPLGDKYIEDRFRWEQTEDTLYKKQYFYEEQKYEEWDGERAEWSICIDGGMPEPTLIETKIILELPCEKIKWDYEKSKSTKYSDLRPESYVKSQVKGYYIPVSEIPYGVLIRSSKGNLVLPWDTSGGASWIYYEEENNNL